MSSDVYRARKVWPTAEHVREMLIYDEETGVFRWRRSIGGRYIHAIAGHLDRDGYCVIKLDRTRYYAADLAWLYIYGVPPAKSVDHKNRIRDDNRISNLRLATQSEQTYNSDLRSNNKSGHKGVYYNEIHAEKGLASWYAYIDKDYKRKYLGRYHTYDEAVAARCKAEKEICGEFAIA